MYGEGDYYAQPVRLRTWQKALIYWLYELNGDGSRAYRRALFGLPKGNGKTPLASWIGSAELAGPVVFDRWLSDGTPRGKPRTSPNVPVGAASFEQADLVFGDMKITWRESPTLSLLADVYDTEILLKGTPGRAYRVAAARGTNDGGRPTCFLADELHEFSDPAKEGAHLVIANGCAKRADSLQLNISTAGSDLDSLLGRMYMKGKRVAAGDEVDEQFLFVWYEGPADVAITDVAELRAALASCNPAAGDFLSIDEVAGRFRAIPEFEARRYYLNQWTRADESWLPANTWQACEDADVEIPDGAPVWAGIDVALRHDSTAVAWVSPLDDGRWVVRTKVWQPAGDGHKLDPADPMQLLRDLADRYDLREATYDPRFFELPALTLTDEGLPMVEFPQSAERMVPACGNAFEMIVAGQLAHDGDPMLEDHVLSAAQRPGERGWTLSKGRSKRKIDACIAMVIALHRGVVTMATPDDPEPFFAVAAV